MPGRKLGITASMAQAVARPTSTPVSTTTNILDLTENEQGGYFSGHGKQVTTGSTVVADTATVVSGLRTTKHTLVNDTGSVERADLIYDLSGISPPGAHGFNVNASKWFLVGIMLDSNYVPQLSGGVGGRFNILMDIHGNVSAYTPWQISINATTGKWCCEINGGGSGASPTSSRFYDLFAYTLMQPVIFKGFVKLASDTTGRSILRASTDGGSSYTTYVDETGPIASTTETGFYLKTAHYRGGNLGGGTTSVYHSGWITGDNESDLALVTGRRRLGYTTIGGTATANGIGKRGSGPYTMTENGTVTHLSNYFDFTGAGSIEALGVLYADNAGVPGAKLGQTRVYTPNASTEPSGVKDIALARPVALTVGQKVWVLWYFGGNAAATNWRGDAVGTNTFFSDGASWTTPNGPSDPAGANATGNPNRTMTTSLLYEPA